MKTITSPHLTELEEFVVYQAAEDAVLPLDEQRLQAKLVNDVLSQEVSAPGKLNELLAEYKANLKTYKLKRPLAKV